jgi:hypothetical protein
LFSFRLSGALCATARVVLDVSLFPLGLAFFAGALASVFFVLLVMAQLISPGMNREPFSVTPSDSSGGTFLRELCQQDEFASRNGLPEPF